MINNNESIKKALKERESRYRNLVEGLNEAIYRMSLPDGNYEYFSPAVKKVFGYSAKEFLNNPLLIKKIIHPDFKNYFKKKWAELINGKVPPIYEYKIIDPKGKHRWIIQSNKGTFDSNGNISAIEGICRDITKQKEAEDKLAKSEDRLRKLFDTSPIYVVTLNKTGIITSCNKSLLKHFKNTKENVVGKHFAKLSFLSLKDIPKYLKIFASVISGKNIKPFEISWKHTDGKIYFCELFVSTIKIANKITGLQIVLNDITSRKKIEDLTKIHRDLIIKLSSISDIKEALKVCTDTAIKATGMDCGGVYLLDIKTQDINLSYSKGLPNSFIKSASKYSKDSPNAKLVMAGKPIYIQHHKLGVPLDKISYKEKLLAIAAIPIKHEDSVIACLNIASYTLSEIPVNTRDILESIANLIGGVIARIADREALKESEEFNKSILESSPGPKLVINLDTSINYVNPAFEKLTGFKSKEIIGIKAPYPWWIKESQDVTYQKLNEAMKNGLEKTEISFNKKNGEKLWLELTFILIKKDGKTKYYLSNWVDITDRKKAEEALKESEEKYRSIFENPIIGAYKSTLGGKYIDVNSTLVKMLGYPSKKDLLLVDIKKDLYCSEKDRPSYNKRKEPFKVHLKKKDGSRIWVEVSSKVIYNNGKPIGYEGIVIDITERKKAEGKLRYLSFHDSLTGIYNRTFFSEELERLQKSRDFPISIISLDVDGLKVINDYLGHSKGDKLLTTLTILVQKAIRKSDIFARVGGDEFVILLPKTDYDKGREIIDRISEEIENHNDKNESFPLILSTGLATSFNKADKLIETNIRADNVMYNEKNSKKQKSREIIGNYLNKLNK
jgi:diguanylate cyclase (GGDEF)-like protein/PAS domain S-box-containing protein